MVASEIANSAIISSLALTVSGNVSAGERVTSELGYPAVG